MRQLHKKHKCSQVYIEGGRCTRKWTDKDSIENTPRDLRRHDADAEILHARPPTTTTTCSIWGAVSRCKKYRYRCFLPRGSQQHAEVIFAHLLHDKSMGQLA